MISEKFIFVLASLLSGAVPIEQESMLRHAYANMNGGPNVGFFEQSPRMVLGDEVIKLNDCSTSSVTCTEAEGIFIAIPFSTEGTAKDGTKVVVAKHLDVSLLGRQMRVRIIDARRGSVSYRYWYSDELGLVAFTVSMQGDSVLYVLQQASGLKAKGGHPK
jgi:hypothetical protein